MAIKDGTSVLIKTPRGLVGTVVKQRPGDQALPPEERCYIVRIEERVMIYRPQDIEPIEEPAETFEKYSPEWNAEMARWIDAGQRVMADNNDLASWREFVDAGSKLGFFVPISD